MTIAQSVFQIVYCQSPKDIKSLLKSVLYFDSEQAIDSAKPENHEWELLKFKFDSHFFEFALVATEETHHNAPLFLRIKIEEWDDLKQRIEFWCYRHANSSITLVRNDDQVVALEDKNGQKWFIIKEDLINISELLH